MTKTAAKRQAHRESHMYREGSGWIVSTWDEIVKSNRDSYKMTHSIAKQSLADWRRNRIEQLLSRSGQTKYLGVSASEIEFAERVARGLESAKGLRILSESEYFARPAGMCVHPQGWPCFTACVKGGE